MHLEASLPSVCDFEVPANLKVELDVANSFGGEFASYIEPMLNLALIQRN